MSGFGNVWAGSIYRNSAITQNHNHPIESACAPDMMSRRAALSFTTVPTAGQNFVLGSITYSFVTAFSSPAAGTAQIVIAAGDLKTTVQRLAFATRGLASVNISYGAGTSYNMTCVAYWTGQRFAVGTTIVSVSAGQQGLFILERAENSNAAITFTNTLTSAVSVAFTRASFANYLLNGNTSPGSASVRGDMQCIFPIGSIIHGGQLMGDGAATYDVHEIILVDQSDTSEKEADLYASIDEVTFIRLHRSLSFGNPSTSTSIHEAFQTRMDRFPPGYGFFIKIGSDGTSATGTIALKFHYHLYPDNLSEVI